jgi:hypothetical protein
MSKRKRSTEPVQNDELTIVAFPGEQAVWRMMMAGRAANLHLGQQLFALFACMHKHLPLLDVSDTELREVIFHFTTQEPYTSDIEVDYYAVQIPNFEHVWASVHVRHWFMNLLRAPQLSIKGLDELRSAVDAESLTDIKHNQKVLFRKLVFRPDPACPLPDIMCRLIACYVH